MHARTSLLLPLLVGGCLSQRIDAFLDELELTSSGTEGSTGETSSGALSSEGSTTGEPGSEGVGTGAATGSESESESESGSGDGSEESSSGVTPVVCGDGIVAEAEECDDGNDVPDDGCSNTCDVDLRVFVTSELYKAGELMGPYLADAICLNRADDAGLAQPHRFKAWLSSSEEDARDRFNRERRGRLVMVNGLVLAAGWEELLAGQLENPLEVTEIGTTYHGKVWTGTKANGTSAVGTDHCLDWTTDSVMHDGFYGYSDEISFEWTLADQIDNPLPCIAPLAVFCFESF